jgi:tRNA(Ile2) C34 agmatinyltransferase TiaS
MSFSEDRVMNQVDDYERAWQRRARTREMGLYEGEYEGERATGTCPECGDRLTEEGRCPACGRRI